MLQVWQNIERTDIHLRRNADGDARIYDSKGNLVEFKVKGGGKDSVIKQNTQRSYNVGDKEFKSLSAAVDDVLKKNNRTLYSRTVEPELDEATDSMLFKGVVKGASQESISETVEKNLTRAFRELDPSKFRSAAELTRHKIKLVKASLKEFNINNIDVENSPILSEKVIDRLSKFVNLKRVKSIKEDPEALGLVRLTPKKQIVLAPNATDSTVAEEFVHLLLDHSDDINQNILNGIRDLGYLRGELDKKVSQRISPYIRAHMEDPINFPKDTVWMEAGAKLITDMMTDSVSKSGVEWELLKGNFFKAFIKSLKLLFRRIMGLRDKTFDLFNTIDEEAARVLKATRKGGDSAPKSKKRDLFSLRADEPTGKISPDDTSVSILRPVVQKIEAGATDEEVLSAFEKALKITKDDLSSVEASNAFKDIDVDGIVEKQRGVIKQLKTQRNKEYKRAEATIANLIDNHIPNDINLGEYMVNTFRFFRENFLNENIIELHRIVEKTIDIVKVPTDVIAVAKKVMSQRKVNHKTAKEDYELETRFQQALSKAGLSYPHDKFSIYHLVGLFKPMEGSNMISFGDRLLRNKGKSYNQKVLSSNGYLYKMTEDVSESFKESLLKYSKDLKKATFSKTEARAIGGYHNQYADFAVDNLERELLFKKALANIDLKQVLSKVRKLRKEFVAEMREEIDDARYQLKNIVDTINGSGAFPEVEKYPALMKELDNTSSHPNISDAIGKYNRIFRLENLKDKAKYLVKNVFGSNKKGKQYDKYTKEFYPDSYYKGLDHLTYLHHHSHNKADTENFIRELSKLTDEDIDLLKDDFDNVARLAADANERFNYSGAEVLDSKTKDFSDKNVFTPQEKEFLQSIKYLDSVKAQPHERYLESLKDKPNRLSEFTKKSAKLLSPITIEKISKIFGGQAKRIRFKEFLPPNTEELRRYRLIDNSYEAPHLVAIFTAPKLPTATTHVKRPASFFAIRENTDDNGILWSNIQSDVKAATDVYSTRENMLYQTLQEIIRMSGNKKVYFPTGQTNTFQQGNNASSSIYDKTIPQLIKRLGLGLEKRFINTKREAIKDKVLEVYMVVGQDKLKTRPHELFSLKPDTNPSKINSGRMLSKAMDKAMNERHQNEIRQVLQNELKILDEKQAKVKELKKLYDDSDESQSRLIRDMANIKGLLIDIEFMLIDNKIQKFIDTFQYSIGGALGKSYYNNISKLITKSNPEQIKEHTKKLITDLKAKFAELKKIQNNEEESMSLIHRKRIINNILKEKEINPDTIMKHINKDERIFREGQSEFDYNNQQENVYRHYSIMRRGSEVNEDNFEVIFFDSMANKYHMAKSNFAGVHFPSNIEHEFFAFVETMESNGKNKILISNIQQSDFLKQIEKGLYRGGEIRPRHPYTDKGNKLFQVVEEILTQYKDKEIYFPTRKLNDLQQNDSSYTGHIYGEWLPKILKRLKVSFEKEVIDTKYGPQPAYRIMDRGVAGKRPRDLFALKPDKDVSEWWKSKDQTGIETDPRVKIEKIDTYFKDRNNPDKLVAFWRGQDYTPEENPKYKDMEIDRYFTRRRKYASQFSDKVVKVYLTGKKLFNPFTNEDHRKFLEEYVGSLDEVSTATDYMLYWNINDDHKLRKLLRINGFDSTMVLERTDRRNPVSSDLNSDVFYKLGAGEEGKELGDAFGTYSDNHRLEGEVSSDILERLFRYDRHQSKKGKKGTPSSEFYSVMVLNPDIVINAKTGETMSSSTQARKDLFKL